MKKTLEKINELVESRIIDKYAIGGGMGQFYYIEPSVTYDLDIIINSTIEENNFIPLQPIYEWAKKNNYELLEEHIIIEGIPVQFLPVYNDLVEEALDNSREIILYDVKTFILSQEYLMAIMLQTGRAKDKERLLKFFEEADFSKEKFNEILNKFDLIEKYQIFRKRFYE
jgi:hypothetical protein